MTSYYTHITTGDDLNLDKFQIFGWWTPSAGTIFHLAKLALLQDAEEGPDPQGVHKHPGQPSMKH